MTGHLGRIWESFWFAPLAARPMLLVRIVLPTYVATLRLPHFFHQYERTLELPPEFLQANIGTLWMPLPPPLDPALLPLLRWGLTAAFACGALGLWTRPALFVAAVGFLHVAGVATAHGWYNHITALTAPALLVLPFAPGIERLSLDAWWRSRRPGSERARSDGSGPLPGWAFRLVLALLVVGYLNAGVSKLRHGGPAWLDGQTLSFYLGGESDARTQLLGVARDPDPAPSWKDGVGLTHYLYQARPSALGRWAGEQPWLCVGLSLATLLFELLSPLAFLRVARRAFLLAAVALHLGIGLSMQIWFSTHIVLALCLTDPVGWWRARQEGRAA